MTKMHGGAPRVRREVNATEETDEIKINTDKAASIATEALITGLVSAFVTRVVMDREG